MLVSRHGTAPRLRSGCRGDGVRLGVAATSPATRVAGCIERRRPRLRRRHRRRRGTALADNLVLTARHCVATSIVRGDPQGAGGGFAGCEATSFTAPRPAVSFYVSRRAVVAPGGGWVRAREVLTPEGAAYCGGDVALLVLEGDLPPSGVGPSGGGPRAALATPSFAVPAAGLVAVGFGASTPSGAGEGQRRRADAALLCRGDGTGACVASGSGSPEGEPLPPGEVLAMAGGCPGDSGSGLYALSLEQPETSAVLSRGSVGAGCGPSVYGELEPHRALIERAGRRAAATARRAPAAWAGAVTPEDEPVRGRGDAPLGAPCDRGDDCSSGVCAESPWEEVRCSQACDEAAPCPAPFACRWAGPVRACFAPRDTPAEEPPPRVPTMGCGVARGGGSGGAPGEGLALVAFAWTAARLRARARAQGGRDHRPSATFL